MEKSQMGNYNNRDVVQVDAKERKKFIVIGDSILNICKDVGLQRSATGQFINPGATTRDILDHVKPTLQK